MERTRLWLASSAGHQAVTLGGQIFIQLGASTLTPVDKGGEGEDELLKDVL